MATATSAEILTDALKAIEQRTYWSPFPEHPRAYGEGAETIGEEAFKALLGRRFEIDQPAEGWTTASESSPYGLDLGISYPRSTPDALIAAATEAMRPWARATARTRAEICVALLQRLSERSFELAHAVMATTGQAFLMAFQAGGPHALDRGLEAVAYAYREMTRVPELVRWEKPQGRRDPIVMDKIWRVRPRGVAVTLGVSTFTTWNAYPGIFASLSTGNPVIVKPHPATVLPLALFADTARTVLAEAGFNPDLVTLLVDTRDAPIAKELVLRPEVAIVDYTGGSEFGRWLEEQVRHALVFTEKAGVNAVIIDSVDDLAAVVRNLSVSLSMYSGQMCTTPQDIFIPRDGILSGGEQVSFNAVADALTGAIDGLLSDENRAAEVLGAIKDERTLARIDAAAASGKVLSASRALTNPRFPDAVVRTPVVVQVDADDEQAYMREMFGPVIYLVATDDTADSLRRATRAASEHGALSWLLYTTDPQALSAAEDAAVEAGVPLSVNLVGNAFVNQAAAFSDFHVSGANPAGNATLTDPAFVANRFRIVGIRRAVAEAAPASG